MDEKKSSDDVIKLLNKLYYKRNRSVGEVVATRDHKQVKFPLAGVDIEANVVGRVADVTLSQKYRNCYPENLEATYTFPLTASCSVYSVEMKINDRLVKGQIEERAVARQNYQQALDDGKRACLMEQDRDEIFTISVGNIQPDEEVTIEIRYCETLTYFEDGSTEIRVPLVVAPKYIPGESVAREQVGSGVTLDTDRVQDASRISPPRLVDGFDPETDLNICVSIANTVSKLDHTDNIKNLACSQHATKTSFDDGFIEVSLANKRELMDRDFVLRWQLASKKIQSAFISNKDKKLKRQTGMVSILPPEVEQDITNGRDIVFLLDRSGSMMGEKMVSAKRACKYLLSSLGPSDRFSINAFDHTMDWFKVGYLTDGLGNMHYATEESVNAGLDFLTKVDAAGGTEIGNALQVAFQEFDKIENSNTPVVVLITDGHIGFESNVLNSIQNLTKKIRVFTVGIDSSVNYGFLERIADISGATSSMVNPGDELERSMRKIARTIGEPLIQNIEIVGVNCTVDQSTLTPVMLPDLFEGRSADFYFQFEKTGRTKPKILVRGTYRDGSAYTQELTVARRSVIAVSRLWAKRVISDLEDQYRCSYEDQEDIQLAIVDLSKQFSVLSRFTAYTVIDDEEIETKNLGLRQTTQPVHNPASWGAPSQAGGAYLGCAAPGDTGSIGSIGAFSLGQNDLEQFGKAYGDSGDGTWGAADSCTWGAADTGTWGSSSLSNGIAPSQNLSGSPINMPPGASQSGSGQFDIPMPPASQAPQSGSFTAWGQVDENQKESNENTSGSRVLKDSEIDEIFKRLAGTLPTDEKENGVPGWLSFLSDRDKGLNQEVSQEIEEESFKDEDSSRCESALLDKLTSIGNRTTPEITKPLLRVIVAIDSFFNVWNKSFREIESGHLPDINELNQVYEELTEALEDHPVSFELPKLATFLNLNFKSFCSYLSAPNHTIPALRALKKQLNSGYDPAYAEVEAVLTRALGKKGAFWQFTV